MLRKIISIIILLSFAFPWTVSAEDFRPVKSQAFYNSADWDKEPEYINRAFGKLAFGFWNFLLGWTKIAREPYEAAVLDDNVLIGAARGLAWGVLDTAGGFLNMITFPITALKIPLPEGGVDSREF